MKIRTKYENTKCRICGTHIRQWQECEWTEGVSGVTCLTPCTPRVAAKKPRKNAPERTATPAMAIPVSVKHTLTVDQAGAIRESLVNLDDQSLRLIQSLIDDLLQDEEDREPLCSPENSMPVVVTRAPFPKPAQVGDRNAYHCECGVCGHIWDNRQGKPDRCNWCDATPLAIADKLGGCFNPIETHSCKQWAFHDAQNPEHKRNCTQCQLTPEVYTDLSIPVKPVTPQVVSKPVKPKFSF